MMHQQQVFWARPFVRAALFSLVGAGVLLGIGGIVRGTDLLADPREETIEVTNAAERTILQTGSATDASTPQTPVPIEVDATQSAPPDAEQLKTVLDAVSRLADPVSAAPSAQMSMADPQSSTPNWRIWGRMETERTPVTFPGTDAGSAVGVYGVHSRAGATVVLWNQTRQKTPTRLRIRLPRGVYKIERLSFAPPVTVAERDDLAARHRTLCAPPGTIARLDRLESGDLASAGTMEKPLLLTPEQVCLIRFTDVSYIARATFYETREKVKSVAAASPTVARRLSAIFKQGDPYISGLTAGGPRTLTKRLGCIHRLLLLTAQAHSMHHNAQQRNAAYADAGASLMDAIERLNESLTETSAALLGLVPQVSLELEEEGEREKGQEDSSFILHPSSFSPNAGRSATVTISLANTGLRSVEFVKIGLNVSALSPGVVCDPGDPAMFGTLRPGQTARATFRLRWNTDAVLTSRRCVGDVSYFVGSAPAHLRPRPW